MWKRLLFLIDPKWKLLTVTSGYDYTGGISPRERFTVGDDVGIPVLYQVYYSERCPEEIKVLKTHKGFPGTGYATTFQDPDDPKILKLKNEFKNSKELPIPDLPAKFGSW